jgi:signal transduction histidine kinase/ActR/RegA family two-component response regulator
MSVVRRLSSLTPSVPWLLGVASLLVGGGLLIFRVLTPWVGLAILGLGVACLTLSHWWERRRALAVWIPLLLGAAVLLAGIAVWQTLRRQEALEVDQRLDLAARGAGSEIEHRLDMLSEAVADLRPPGPGGPPRSLADLQRDIQWTFETHPSLRAVEWHGPDGEVRLLGTRPGASPRVSRPGPLGLALLGEAVGRAHQTGERQVAGPFSADVGDASFRVLVPITAADGHPATLSGLYSASGAFSGIAETVAPRHDLRILAGARPVFQAGDFAETTWVRRRPLVVPGGADWSLEVAPTRSLVVEEQTGFAEAVLAVSVALALVLALTSRYGEQAAQRARRFEAAVAERTAELEAAKAEAQAASAAKDRFLAMLGHELRNPLASVSTALEVLQRQQGEDPRREGRMRGIVQRQMGHMARLVDDLLDVSRIEQGKLPLRLERLDLARLVREVAEAERARIEQAGLTLEIETPAGPLWVDGDPTRLTQVVYNLLSNAVKFTEPGGEVRVRAVAEPHSGRAAISVRDSGLGIDPADLERIFAPFAQTEDAVERAAGGLGLGLPIVKGLVDAHGGEILAVSPGRGRGAELTVRLPSREAPASEAERPSRARPAAGRRILVIDDHLDSAEGLRDLLHLFGHEVEVAGDGTEGLKLAARVPPDLVICDISLPGELDGYRVAETLRREPRGASLQLIALTGLGDEESIRRAMAAGFDRHLTKPVDPELLREVVSAEAGERSPEPLVDA